MKRPLIVFLVILGLVSLVAGIFRGPRLYRNFFALRLRHAAQNEAALGHADQAIHFYVLSLQRSPSDLQILREFAGYLQKLRHPGLVEVRRQIYSLEPKDPDAGLELASAELTFGRVTDALRVLARVGSQQAKDARYYHLLSVARFMAGDLPAADAACKEALKLEPENKTYLVNRATIELSSPTEAVRQEAVDRLERLSEDARTAVSALQSLLRFAASSNMAPVHLDQWLQAFARYAQPRDYLFTLRLETLRRHRPDEFRRELPSYLQNASRDADSAAAAVGWLAGQHLFADVLSFREGLPVEWQDKMEILSAATEASFELGQTERTGEFLTKAAWKSTPADALAWHERLERRNRPPGATGDANASHWQKILAAAGESGPALARLLNLTLQWGWRDEYAATLWRIAEHVPEDSADAIRDLFALDLRTGDSRDLLRVVKKQAAMEPDNPNYRNNVAFLDLLLETDSAQGEAMAKDLCARYPENPAFLATLAFANLRAGKPEEGLRLFSKVDPAALRGTSVGATYGLLLAATGNRKAAEFLKNAEVWMRLPEEQKLLEAARLKVAGAPNETKPTAPITPTGK